MVWVQFLLPLPFNYLIDTLFKITAIVVKWLTHQIVALAFVGSIPIGGSISFLTHHLCASSGVASCMHTFPSDQVAYGLQAKSPVRDDRC